MNFEANRSMNSQKPNLKMGTIGIESNELETSKNDQKNIELEKAENDYKAWQDNYWNRRSDGSTAEELELEQADMLENIERKKGKASFYRNKDIFFDDQAKLSIVKQEQDNSSKHPGAYTIHYHLPENKGNLSYIESQRNSNEWHITANMPNNDKPVIKEAFERVNKVLPKNAVIFEDLSISIDGLRTWSQQLKHGYILEGGMTSPDLSDVATNKLFSDLNLLAPDTKWSAIKFKNLESATKGKERLERFLKNNNIDFSVTISSDYSLKILLPKLKKL